jgi:uncharacterized protein (DUF2062 family)
MPGRAHSLTASSNPIVQVVSLILVGLALIVAVLFGAVLLSVIFGVAMIAAIVIALRVWWIRRKFERMQPSQGAVIETEYRVIHERDAEERSDRRD